MLAFMKLMKGNVMGVATAVKSVGRAIGNTIEAAIIPTKVQQWYMHYQLAETTLGETNIPRPFLSQMAELADHIYLTGTRRSHAKSTYEGAHALKKELGALFQNYYQVDRFNAATGMFFNTMGPFGAMVACVTPPNAETLQCTIPTSPKSYRYRLFFVFRGTKTGLAYWDDVSTDLKFLKRDSTIGNKKGDIASGFLSTYESCQKEVIERLLPRGISYLNAEYGRIAAAFQKPAVAPKPNAAGKLPPPLPPRPASMFKLSDADIEVYVVGHSLGGAVATLCAYDLTCKRPSLNPVLVTFGSPPVGNVDFAVDYQKVMVDTNKFHPHSGYLRSVRIVAKTTGKHADIITSAPDLAPNAIHVNTKVPLDTNVEGWLSMLSAHSIANSYGQGLKQ